jgi:hypothetical protein
VTNAQARIAFAPSDPLESRSGSITVPQSDQRYEHALSAALVILGEFDKAPDMAKHNRLALVIFSILHAWDQWEHERRDKRAGFSAN